MKVEMRDEKTLIVTPESTAEMIVLRGFGGAGESREAATIRREHRGARYPEADGVRPECEALYRERIERARERRSLAAHIASLETEIARLRGLYPRPAQRVSEK